MGLLGGGLGRAEGLVGDGVTTLRLGVSVVCGSSPYSSSSSDSRATSLSGSFVSGKTSMVVVSGGEVVGICSSSSSSSSSLS